ncbi:MAG: HAD family hydrolase [Candidatus Gracilibacteria bacterium]
MDRYYPQGREGIDPTKMMHFMKVVTGGTRKADAYMDKFTHINRDLIRIIEKKTNRAVTGLLLDVDACIAPAYDEILPENLAHIKKLLEYFKIGIYSNCHGMPRLNILKEMGIRSYEGKLAKPYKEGFRHACNDVGLDYTTTCMIGDNPNTDGGGLPDETDDTKLRTIFVQPIPDNHKILPVKKKMILPFQNLTRKAAILATTVGNKNIIRSGK